jgi:anti-anti-sigma factor
MQSPSDRDPIRIDALGVRPPDAFTVEELPAHEEVTLLVLRGELDLAAAASMRARVEAARRPTLVIDLAEVTFLDSSGLRELLNARDDAERRGARLVLCGVPARVLRLMQLTGTAALFEQAPTRDDALGRSAPA